MSVNKVILVGNLGADPEIKYTANSDAICTLSIATSETRKDKQTGEKKTATEWHRVIFFGDLAEIVGKWLKKGSTIYIEGKLRTRKWQDQQGNDKYTTEILADTMRMLGDSKKSSNHTDDNNMSPKSNTYNAPKLSDEERREQSYSQREQSLNNTGKPSAMKDAFEDDDIPF